MKTLFTSVCLLATSLVYTQITFEKTFSGTGELMANDIHQTTDGGYIIAGTGNYSYMSSGDMLLMKLDAQGDTMWTKFFGGFAAESGNAVVETSDGGYLIAGSTNSFGAGGMDAFLVKTDLNGNFLWSKTIGTIGNDAAYGLLETADGGFVFAGNELTYGLNGYAHLVKTDANGNVVWSKTYGNNLRKNYGFALKQTLDNGFIIGGYENNYLTTNDEFSLIKTDSVGTMQWYKSYGDLNYEHNFTVCATPDGGFAIAGINFELPGYNYDVNLLKTGADGTLKWTKSYGGAGHEDVYALTTTSDGGFVFAGSSNTFSGYQNGFYTKTDSIGSVAWSKTTSGTGYDIFQTVIQTNDGGFILAGVKDEVYGVSGNLFIVKTDPDGNTPCNQSVSPYTIVPPTIVGPLLASGNSTPIVSPQTPDVSAGLSITSLCCEAPGGLFTSNITTNKARLNWTIEPGAVQYEVWYKKSTVATWKKKFVPGTQNKMTLKNLQCSKSYNWQIRTICDTVGVDIISSFSPMQTFSTLICREAADRIDDNILVYPNPARNLIYISIPQTGDYQYQIVDITGKIVQSGTINNISEGSPAEVNLNQISSGMYIINIIGDNTHYFEKIIIEK